MWPHSRLHQQHPPPHSTDCCCTATGSSTSKIRTTDSARSYHPPPTPPSVPVLTGRLLSQVPFTSCGPRATLVSQHQQHDIRDLLVDYMQRGLVWSSLCRQGLTASHSLMDLSRHDYHSHKRSTGPAPPRCLRARCLRAGQVASKQMNVRNALLELPLLINEFVQLLGTCLCTQCRFF
jgi:hypothetical protein